MSRLVLFTCLILLTVFVAGLAIPADAAAYLYADKRKTVNCGILDVGQGSGVWDSVGTLFFLLETNAQMKPAGWTFNNVMAGVSASSGAGKSTVDYWKINLESADDLSGMDVLYLPATGTLNLTRASSEKLRKFVDNGGVLWIDNVGTGVNALDFNGTFFIKNFKFATATSAAPDVPVNRHHPLLAAPYWLTEQDIAIMGQNPGNYCYPGYSFGGTWASVADAPIYLDVLLPVVGNGGIDQPSIAANAYGSGRIVATSNYVGAACYRPYPYGLPAMKFAYNVMAYAAAWTDFRKDVRRSGATIGTVSGSRLNKLWSIEAPPDNGAATGRSSVSAAIYKNVTFYASEGKLYALDLMPQEDLDHDGNPDDGVQGLPSGMTDTGQDIVWVWTAPGASTLSAPSVISVLNPADPGSTLEVVMTMGGDGVVYMVQAFPTVAGGRLDSSTSIVLSKSFAAASGTPFPPIYVNGWIYANTSDGKLHAYNPALENWRGAGPGRSAVAEWLVDTASDASVIGDARCGPSFGFVKSDNTGATIGTVYWMGGTNTTGTDEQNDSVYSVPVQVNNERVRLSATPGAFILSHVPSGGRIAMAPAPCSVFVIYAPRPNPDGSFPSDPEPKKEVIEIPDANRGSNTVSPVPTIYPTITRSDLVYATYCLDYSAGTAKANKKPIRNPSSTVATGVPLSQITGTPALGSDNMLFFGANRLSDFPDKSYGGSVYAYKNDGQTQRSAWQYLLHSGLDVQTSTGDDITIPATVVGKDAAGVPVNMADIKVTGSPVVVGDKVFVTVSSNVTGGTGPAGGLLCFRANPSFTIRVVTNSGYEAGGAPRRTARRLYDMTKNPPVPSTVRIWQPDLFTDSAAGTVSVPSVSSGRTFTVSGGLGAIDHERGTITITNFDLLTIGKGGLSPSLPVWVFVDNVEVPVDWTTWQPRAQVRGLDPVRIGSDAVDLSGWNNLLWYFPVMGSHISGSPVVVGNLVYFVTDDGGLYSLNAETGESHAQAVSARNLIMNNFPIGATGTLPAATNISPASANGILLVPGADGLYAFMNSSTLVADSQRALEVDGSGEVKWSVDSIMVPVGAPQTPDGVPPVKVAPVNRPSKVRYTDDNHVLIVNTGSDMVCKIDKAGFVSMDTVTAPSGTGYIRWVYQSFNDPLNLLKSGETRELKSPTDARMWFEYETMGGVQMLVYHCLIADSGNNRVLDLVYKLDPATRAILNSGSDPDTGFYLPDLNWVSKTRAQKQRYIFDCIQTVPTGPAEMLWAAISNYATGTGTSGAPPAGTPATGGAIVAMGYREAGAGGDSWNYAALNSGVIVGRNDRITDPTGAQYKLSNPKFFQVYDRPTGRFVFICDNRGVYKTKATGGNLVLENAEDYLSSQRYMSLDRYQDDILDPSLTVPQETQPIGVPLKATGVQWLTNGRWLITNTFSGTNKPGTSSFGGEVFEYDPAYSTWDVAQQRNNLPVPWSSPSLSFSFGPGGFVWKQTMTSSYLLRQPKSAVREF